MKNQKPLVIVVANQKGGVGKSTICQNLGYCLSHNKINTSIIDLDPQGNTTKSYPIKTSDEIIRMFEGESIDQIKINGSSLSLLPSHKSLAVVANKMTTDYNLLFKLRDYVNNYCDTQIILIDTPPTLIGLTVSAFASASHLLIPISSTFYSTHGVNDLLETFEMIKERLNPELKLLGFCVSIFDTRTSLSEEVVKEIQSSFGDLVFDSIIPKTVKVEEAQSSLMSVCEMYPSSKVSKSYFSLSEEIIKRVEI